MALTPLRHPPSIAWGGFNICVLNMSKTILSPIFDQADYLNRKQLLPDYLKEFSCYQEDFQGALSFLMAYKDIPATFNAYRREVERLLQWSWRITKKSIYSLKREDIEAYLKFCQNPPATWISLQKQPRFITTQVERLPNSLWRPFVATVTKAAYGRGLRPKAVDYKPSNTSLKELLAILGSFFNYLLQEEYVKANPVALIRQKSKFIRKEQGINKIRRLSELQWQYVIKKAEELADHDPPRHERTLFIMSILYSMYLRISELTASDRWSPSMNHFYRDNSGHWWFTTVGKGNKQRSIAVSDATLVALKRWRKYLGLSSLPSSVDSSPLLPKLKSNHPIADTSRIRNIVQHCFNSAMEKLRADGHYEEAENLTAATVHWLRHTGISDDIKHRPREHVRDDAGHSSSAITDKYIDIELRERHRSARHKPMK